MLGDNAFLCLLRYLGFIGFSFIFYCMGKIVIKKNTSSEYVIAISIVMVSFAIGGLETPRIWFLILFGLEFVNYNLRRSSSEK